MTTPIEHARQIRLTGLGLSLLVLIYANLGSFSLEVSEYVRFGGVMLLTGLTYGIFEFAARTTQKNMETRQVVKKIFAALTVISILTCALSATISIGTSPFEQDTKKFFYENLSTAAIIASVIFGTVLSTLQKDLYWITRRKTAEFDERIIKERQEIFEMSYKVGIFLTVGTIILIDKAISNMFRFSEITNSFSIPGVFYWIPISLVIGLYALPMTIAAWKNK
jgi:hypothetical protein